MNVLSAKREPTAIHSKPAYPENTSSSGLLGNMKSLRIDNEGRFVKPIRKGSRGRGVEGSRTRRVVGLRRNYSEVLGIVSTGIRDFRDLVLWQRAMQYAKEVYLISRAFPADERFGLTSQLRRAAVSVSSNVAEGHARQGREYAHFLSVARGSLAESESQLLLAVELGYIAENSVTDCLNTAQEIRLMAIAITKKLPPK